MVESRRPAVLVFGQNGPYVNEFWSLIHYLARHLLLLEERRIELGQLR